MSAPRKRFFWISFSLPSPAVESPIDSLPEEILGFWQFTQERWSIRSAFIQAPSKSKAKELIQKSWPSAKNPWQIIPVSSTFLPDTRVFPLESWMVQRIARITRRRKPMSAKLPFMERLEKIRREHNGVFGIKLFLGHDGAFSCAFTQYQSEICRANSGLSLEEAVERCEEEWEKRRKKSDV